MEYYSPSFLLWGTLVSDISLTSNGGARVDTRQAVAERILELCRRQRITPNGLSYLSAVPQATIKCILNGETKNAGIVTIKKLCDGLEISLTDFFDTETFRHLEQEIR